MTKSISDFVASSMDAIMKSEQHRKLFNKFASDEKSEDKEDCDLSAANDEGVEVSFEELYPEAAEFLKLKFPEAAKMLEEHNLEEKYPQVSSFEDEKYPNSNEVLEGLGLEGFGSYDIAIDSLLTASNALDELGMEKTAELSLKLASLVVEAKKADKGKEDKEKLKAKKEKEAAKLKALKEKEKAKKEADKKKKDEQDAKDKLKKEKDKEKLKALKEKEQSKKNFK